MFFFIFGEDEEDSFRDIVSFFLLLRFAFSIAMKLSSFAVTEQQQQQQQQYPLCTTEILMHGFLAADGISKSVFTLPRV